MAKEKLTPENIGKEILRFCATYLIPPQFFLRIIGDQKVVPMLRGKGMEFSAYLVLKDLLDEREWSVQKLNLAAQANAPDEDISVTHNRTGVRLKIESKSAVRGSFKLGIQSKKFKGIPHFMVKCHRSRSNTKKLGDGEGNDKYTIDDFDVILSNPENAIYEGNTMGEGFELINDKKAVEFLMNRYDVTIKEELIQAVYADWRFVFPTDIVKDGFIPRTPYVQLDDDPHWHPVEDIEERLTELIRNRHFHKPRSS